MGKRTVRFMTLYAIPTLFLPKTVVKHSKFKSQNVIHLLKCRIYGEPPYNAKAKKIRARFKGALEGLRQLLITESPLKMMKNAFYFTLKALFVVKIFKFLS